MYCPKCKEHREGKFCPECGAQLIDDPNPQEGSINLSFGDANAISGGVHVTDSHEVHNIDNSVHNITNQSTVVNNVTNIAAQKTEHEVHREARIQFREVCEKVFEDGILEPDEVSKLEKKRIELGIDENTAKQIIEAARAASASRLTSLTRKDSITVDILKGAVRGNNLPLLDQQFPRLEALAASYIAVDDVQFLFYMVLAALRPITLIQIESVELTDNYWRDYWSYIAYLKQGDALHAEAVALKLNNYTQYSQENDYLLSAVDQFQNFGAENAKAYLGAVTGQYTTLLKPFVTALQGVLENNEISPEYDFYVNHLIRFESVQERQAREEARRKKITYSVFITGVQNQLLAMMIMRSAFGWGTEESRARFLSLPYKLLQTEEKKELDEAVKKLAQGQMTFRVEAMNGLGEPVEL